MKARRFASANRSLRLSTIAVASVASLGGTAHAAEGPGDTQSLPCRPTIACTAELVAPGAFELETGALTRRFADHAQQLSDPFLAKLTLTTWVQLQVGSNGYTNEQGKVPARYFDNVYGGPKFHLSDQTAKLPSVSFSFAASLPTVAQEGYVRGDDLRDLCAALNSERRDTGSDLHSFERFVRTVAQVPKAEADKVARLQGRGEEGETEWRRQSPRYLRRIVLVSRRSENYLQWNCRL